MNWRRRHAVDECYCIECNFDGVCVSFVRHGAMFSRLSSGDCCLVSALCEEKAAWEGDRFENRSLGSNTYTGLAFDGYRLWVSF